MRRQRSAAALFAALLVLAFGCLPSSSTRVSAPMGFHSPIGSPVRSRVHSPVPSSGKASDFTVDFSVRALSYAGITASRGGTAPTVYLQTNATTATTSTGASEALWEDRGDGPGGGVWALGSYTNQAPSAFDLSSTAGWNVFGAISFVNSDGSAAYADPSGGTGAQRVRDPSASQIANNYDIPSFSGLTGTQSLWGLNWPGDVPTETATFLGGYGSGNFPMNLSSSWSRQQATGTMTYCGVFPSATNSSDVAGIGSIAAWGASCVTGSYDVPLVDGGKTCSASLALTSGTLSKIVVGGDLDVEVSYLVAVPSWDQMANSDVYVWYLSTPDGELSLRYSPASAGHILRVRGVDTITATSPTNQYSNKNQIVVVRAWYRPSQGDSGVRVSVNGAYSPDKTSTASGSALAAPTSGYLGSNSGASSLNARIQRLRRPKSLASVPVEAVLVGDSIIAPYTPSAVADAGVGTYLYTPSQARSRPGIGVTAHPGDVIATQESAWLASPWSTATSVKAVSIQIGVNDIIANTSAATILASLQDLVTTVRASPASPKVILWQITPCHAVLSTAQYTVWQAVNASIGSGSITGVDAIGTSLQYGGAYAIGDSSDNLLAAYDGDHLHPNAAGRAVEGQAQLAVLHAIGVL